MQAGRVEPECQYTAAEVERMFKLNDVILKAMAKRITWWEAAEIIGVTPRTMRRWRERLARTGFEIEKSWDYFPPKALHVLEMGHYFGLPALVTRKLTGRWILAPNRANLALPWAATASMAF